MVALARTRGAWPSMRHLALEATRGRADKAHAVGEWVQRRIHYTRERGEQLEAPEYTLRMQAADCDGHAILVAALLDSIGVPWRLAYWTRPGEAHVNTQARTGEGWINLETTEPRPMGWTPGAAWHYHTRDKAEDGAMLRLASKPGNKWWRTLNDAPPSRKLPDEWWRTLNDAPPSRKLPDGGHKLPGAERWWQFAQGDEQPGGVYCYNPGTGQFRDTPDGICGCGEVVTKGQVKPRPAQVEAAAAACAELGASAPPKQVGSTPDRNPDADSLTCDACDLAGCAECFTCPPKTSIWIYAAIVAVGIGAGYLAARR